MSQEPDQKPTAEQEEFAGKIYEAVSRRHVGCPDEDADLPERLIATRELAVEAAAYRRIIIEADKALKARGVGGLVRGPLRDRMNALITPPHTAALAAHDREREDALLKKFEGLAGNLRKSGAQSGLMIRRRALFDCADELHSLIEQIRKERE